MKKLFLAIILGLIVCTNVNAQPPRPLPPIINVYPPRPLPPIYRNYYVYPVYRPVYRPVYPIYLYPPYYQQQHYFQYNYYWGIRIR